MSSPPRQTISGRPGPPSSTGVLGLLALILVASIPLAILVWKRLNPKSATGVAVAALASSPQEHSADLAYARPPADADPNAGQARTWSNYTIRAQDTLSSIAARFGMSTTEIEAMNPATSRFVPGERIQVLRRANATPPNPRTFKVATRGLSHGRSNDGWLQDGVQLPKLDHLYWRAQPREQYGTSTVVNHLIEAIERLRQHHNYRGRVVIGDLSIEHGGPFPPHKSHQSGRDVDIWLPVRGVQQTQTLDTLVRPQPEQADWLGTWLLIDSLIHTGAIHKIFLSYHLQEELRAAALAHGVSRSRLRRIIQYPHRHPDAIVRHSPSHTRHIHVRFRCSFRDRYQGRPSCLE